MLEFLAKAKQSLKSLESKLTDTVIKATPQHQTRKPTSPSPEAPNTARRGAAEQFAESTLSDWQKNNRVKYESIKNKYLKSLDSEKRMVMLEIFSKLSPHKIDDHLKSRITKFMKENPESWLSDSEVKS